MPRTGHSLIRWAHSWGLCSCVYKTSRINGHWLCFTELSRKLANKTLTVIDHCHPHSHPMVGYYLHGYQIQGDESGTVLSKDCRSTSYKWSLDIKNPRNQCHEVSYTVTRVMWKNVPAKRGNHPICPYIYMYICFSEYTIVVGNPHFYMHN